MSLIVSLIIMTLVAILIRKPLKRFPVVFYVLALLASALGVYFTLYTNPNAAVRAVAFAVQKGHVGFALFAVVMFVGIFSNDSRVRRYFNPVRAELSIMAAILIAGHFCLYLRNYMFVLGDFASVKTNVLFSLIIALVILALLIVLTFTSFNAIKRKMKPKTWKRVQTFAYVFFGLIYLHMLGYLLPAALSGSARAITNVAVYSVIFLVYVVLRTRKAVADKKSKSQVGTSVKHVAA